MQHLTQLRHTAIHVAPSVACIKSGIAHYASSFATIARGDNISIRPLIEKRNPKQYSQILRKFKIDHSMAEDDIANFDLSMLMDQQLYPACSDDAAKNYPPFEFERDISLATSWMSAMSNCCDNEDAYSINDTIDYSDTESQAGGSSAVPSPAFTDHNKSFSFDVEDSELINISTKDLNRKLRNKPKATVERIKKRRRTLKNRLYAHACRTKRLEERSDLQKAKKESEETMTEVRQELERVTKERDFEEQEKGRVMRERDLYKAKCEQLFRWIRAQMQKTMKVTM